MSIRVTFIADLHLFTRRSDIAQYVDAIRSAADRSGAMVLGGDIFDFRWSTLSSPHATVEAAVDWLEELAAGYPHCQFHYLSGNHDTYRPFLQRLSQRADAVPNLSWHPFYLRLGDSLFLHGDAAERRMTPERLVRFRSRWLHAEPAGRLQRRAYDLLLRSGMHRPIPYLVHGKRRAARRISRYLAHLGEGPHSGVRNVYFGHTHRRVSAFHYRGLTFHNGGAPIGGQPFRVLETVVD